jgi:Ketopantoate reductase PanE/ApbA
VSERVCIVGCGAISSMFAAHLAQLPDVEVWAYAVSAEHVEAINRDGLRLTGAYDILAPVRATTDPSEIAPCALGIVATKGGATAAAAAATAAVFADGAVCSVQNGIGNEEVLAGFMPRVMRGVTLPAGRIDAPGVVEIYAPGPTWIGPFEPVPARGEEVQALAGLLNAAGLATTACADARGPQWTKLLFNAATNPLCALTGRSHGGRWGSSFRTTPHADRRRCPDQLPPPSQHAAGRARPAPDGDGHAQRRDRARGRRPRGSDAPARRDPRAGDRAAGVMAADMSGTMLMVHQFGERMLGT